MEDKYFTEEEFKKAIELRLDMVFSKRAWDAFYNELSEKGLHVCCDDLDVEDATETYKELKKIFEGLHER